MIGLIETKAEAQPSSSTPQKKPPVINKMSPVSQKKPMIRKLSPASQKKPVVRKVSPIPQKLSPTVHKLSSVSQKPLPVIHKLSPVPSQLSSAPQSPAPQNISAVISKFEQHLIKAIKQNRVPGCAVAIVYKNQVVFMNGYGVRALGKKEKIDLDTVFQLGSVSKPIAATLATILQNQGLLNINDPVEHYLPNFTLKGAKQPKSLTIKHVLSHTTGLPRAGFNNLIESHAPHSRIIRTLQTTPVRSAIGKKYDYNNAMFSLISEITMATTRKTFHDSLANYLLKPLNMTRTTSTYEGLMRTENRASPHVKHKKGIFQCCPIYSKGYYAVAPAGGVNSSVRDMATFLKAQMGSFPHILNNQALARLHQPLIPTPRNSLGSYDGPRERIKNAQYGLGWRILQFNQQKLVFHGGWLKGFTNFVAFLPEHQVGIVILQNAENRFASKTAMRFFDIFLGLR